jgi:hypothetical protein
MSGLDGDVLIHARQLMQTTADMTNEFVAIFGGLCAGRSDEMEGDVGVVSTLSIGAAATPHFFPVLIYHHRSRILFLHELARYLRYVGIDITRPTIGKAVWVSRFEVGNGACWPPW